MSENPETQLAPSSRVVGAARVAEAAEFLGISRTRIYQLIEDNLLDQAVIGGSTLVVLDDLWWKAVQKRRPPPTTIEIEGNQISIREEGI